MLPLKQPQNLKLSLNRNRNGKIEDESRMVKDLERDATNRNSPVSPTKSPVKTALNKTNKRGSIDTDYYIEGDSSDEYGPKYPKLKLMAPRDRITRILNLWRSLFNCSMSSSIFLMQKEWLLTKVTYFGRQMVSDQ